jgi:hypothetical protein
MKNKVKYAPVRKYRDVGFNTVPEKEKRIRTKRSFNVNKKKKGFFHKIIDWIKGK